MAVARYDFEAIGTRWQIETAEPLSQELIRTINEEIVGYDREFSRFDQESTVSRLAREGGSAAFGHGANELFDLYEKLYVTTSGRVTPLIGDTLESLGYDANYSFKASTPRSAKDYATIIRRDGATVTLSEPALLDVGAAGKGHLVDRLAALVGREHDAYVIDGSGDVAVLGVAQTIGLEHPDDPGRVIGHVTLESGALCASASNRRAWSEGLHHIVDPTTGKPVRNIVATWAIADSALIADGLATALFFTNPESLAKDFAFSYVVMRADGSVSYSRDPRIEIYG